MEELHPVYIRELTEIIENSKTEKLLLLAIQTENILTFLNQLQTKEKANSGTFSSISLELCIGYPDSMQSLYIWDAIKFCFMYGLRT